MTLTAARTSAPSLPTAAAPMPDEVGAAEARARELLADRTLPVGRRAIAPDLPAGTPDLLPGPSAAELDQLDHVLTRGERWGTPWVVDHPSADNVLLKVQPLRDAITGARTLAIEKPGYGATVSEVLGVDVARSMGISYLVPAVGRRPDGTAMVERVPGVDLERLGVSRPRDVERLLTQRYRNMGLEGAEIAARARIDAELLGAHAYLIADSDGFGRNLRFSPARGVTRFDFGLAGWGADMTSNPLVPMLAADSQPIHGPHPDPATLTTHRLFEVRVSDATLDILDELGPDDLRRIHARIQSLPQLALPQARAAEQIVREGAFLDDMVGRLGSMLQRGGYHFFAA